MNKKFAELVAAIPAHERRMHKKHRQVVRAVTRAILEKRFMQKDIAERMGVDEASLSRMLSAKGANMTLASVSKIEEALGEDILTTAAEVKEAIAHDLKEARALYEEAKRNAGLATAVSKAANDVKAPRTKQPKKPTAASVKRRPAAIAERPHAERATPFHQAA